MVPIDPFYGSDTLLSSVNNKKNVSTILIISKYVIDFHCM